VSDREAIARAAADIADRSGGAPDILVNNAGRFPLASLDTMDAGEFANTVAVNVLAPFLFVRAFLPAMRARGHGHIVTIGSVADRAVYADNGAYASTKHGQRAMHEVLREETRGSGVRASLVSPGPSDTSIWDAIDPDNREGFTPRAAMLNANAVADAGLWVVTQPATVNIDELRLSRA
jgi:NADP-dependent 3-hydroxy acid dehydrogenase YdfG